VDNCAFLVLTIKSVGPLHFFTTVASCYTAANYLQFTNRFDHDLTLLIKAINFTTMTHHYLAWFSFAFCRFNLLIYGNQLSYLSKMIHCGERSERLLLFGSGGIFSSACVFSSRRMVRPLYWILSVWRKLRWATIICLLNFALAPPLLI
jgi:hypothetical protein